MSEPRPGYAPKADAGIIPLAPGLLLFAPAILLGNAAGALLQYPEVGAAVMFPPYAILTGGSHPLGPARLGLVHPRRCHRALHHPLAPVEPHVGGAGRCCQYRACPHRCPVAALGVRRPAPAGKRSGAGSLRPRRGDHRAGGGGDARGGGRGAAWRGHDVLGSLARLVHVERAHRPDPSAGTGAHHCRRPEPVVSSDRTADGSSRPSC